MLLRSSEHAGSADWQMVTERAEAGRGPDANGYRAELLELVRRARRLVRAREVTEP
jgi:Ca-activated chloride channel family protein